MENWAVISSIRTRLPTPGKKVSLQNKFYDSNFLIHFWIYFPNFSYWQELWKCFSAARIVNNEEIEFQEGSIATLDIALNSYIF